MKALKKTVKAMKKTQLNSKIEMLETILLETKTKMKNLNSLMNNSYKINAKRKNHLKEDTFPETL